MTISQPLSHHIAALQSGSSSAQQLTADALQRATAPDGEGARVFTRLYADGARAAALASA
jgi:aspartyl-tRNA(Asn)/glutamyl-tRNA(Gln) amidotransferase subunit A